MFSYVSTGPSGDRGTEDPPLATLIRVITHFPSLCAGNSFTIWKLRSAGRDKGLPRPISVYDQALLGSMIGKKSCCLML